MTAIEFAEAAKMLADIARRSGAVVPGFQSPPRVKGALRSIRRRADGSATVSVALKGRPRPAVLGDMIDGVIAANDLAGLEAATLRDALWHGVAYLTSPPATIDLREPHRQVA